MKKAEYIVIGKIMEAALAFNNAVEEALLELKVKEGQYSDGTIPEETGMIPDETEIIISAKDVTLNLMTLQKIINEKFKTDK